MLALVSIAAPGCIEDPDCGICDPHNLTLQSISGNNYGRRKIHLLAPTCYGENCPPDFDRGTYFIEPVGPCETSEEALESPQGPEEYCRLAPLLTTNGVEFIFNNLLDPKSVELVRRRPDNPNLFEVYDWKTRVLEIEGPITRYNGDYFIGRGSAPDVVTRAVNLACVDNLAAQNIPYSHLDYADPATDPCNRIDEVTGLPMKMQQHGRITATRGRWETRAVAGAGDRSCDTPEDGVDTCCNQCDFILGTQVAKYGVRSSTDPGNGAVLDGERLLSRDNLRNPHDGSAIECDPEGDVYTQCRDFQIGVDRHDETLRFQYAWSCDPSDPGCARETFRLPKSDRLRETHPDDRPAGSEPRVASCTTRLDCGSGETFADSRVCVGTDASGAACSMDDSGPAALGDEATCGEGYCITPWFVTCRADADTTGPQGYCIDTRFDDGGAGACLRSRATFSVCDEQGDNCQTAPAGTNLAYCDRNEDGTLLANECCQDTLGTVGEDGTCDPAYQSQLAPVERYQRNNLLPEPTRDCVCSELADASAACRDVVAIGCLDDEGRLKPERVGEHAVKFVARRGGIIYDPAIKGFEWRPSDQGGIPRSAVEACAQQRSLIRPRTEYDGWRAHDPIGEEVESYEDFDRAMCSGSEYTVRFAEPVAGEAVEYVVDKLGNTLEGKAEYVFSTPQFRVQPNSGFPTDNLRIGACDEFAVNVTNKYDMSPANLGKVQLWAVDEDGAWIEPQPGCGLVPVAGGLDCAATRAERTERGLCTPPCLTMDVRAHGIGEVRASVDPTEFGRVLETGRRYRLWIPGLMSIDERSDPQAYAGAFWDACGMPLVIGTPDGAVEYTFDFSIDEPKCREDEDRDNVQLSCDNAVDVFNPDQADLDRDGVGDVIDLCPTVPGSENNSADSDRDGVGNACDNCRQTTDQYNENGGSLPTALLVRNIPVQADTDQDGIGDACDNCVRVPNCEAWGPEQPWSPGDPIAYDDANRCQRDDDGDMIGDVCVGQQSELAAGPVGFLPTDDFDQDGLTNADDACPRQPVDVGGGLVACETDEDCPPLRVCELADGATMGVCDHIDSDGDDVGDVCDSCPFVANPMQVLDGAAQEDDADGDFVGRDCETTPKCADRADPRPFAFYEVASQGYCCTTLIVDTADGLVNAITERPIVDPDGIPVTIDCSEADEISDVCRPLPTFSASAPGVLVAPPGCDEALAAAGYSDPSDNPKLGLADVGGDLDALWGNLCLLPQLDQDFDAVGDTCDLCPFVFDPNNRAFIDDFGKVWPKDGAVCNGAYSIDNRCDDDDFGTGTGTGGTGGEGGTGTGGTGTGTGG